MRRAARRFDPEDLAATCGGLQLVPANADRQTRLEAAAAIAASHVPMGGQMVDPERLAGLLNDGALADASFSMFEDRLDGLFTTSVAFDGGPYVALPGADRASAFHLRAVMSACFGGDGLSDQDLAQRVRALIWGALRLGNEVARRAGLVRGMAPVHLDEPGVQIPGGEEFETLKAAVRFTTEEMTQLFAGQTPLLIGELLSTYGTEVGDLLDPPLLSRPVLVYAGRYIVASPPALLTACIHGVLRMAQREGRLPELQGRVRAAVNSSVRRSVERLGCERITGDAWTAPSRTLVSVYQLDTDKALVAYTLADELGDYDADAPWAPTDLDELVAEAETRQLEVEAMLSAQERPPLDIFHAYATHALRPFHVGIGPPLSPLQATRLVIGAPDLEVLSHLERGEALALLKFARAQDQLRTGTHVATADILSEYASYRSASHSFNFADEALPDVIGFARAGGMLYEEVQRRTDAHGVLLEDGARIVEVARRSAEGGEPIFVPTRRSDDVIRHFVEMGRGFWVTVAEPGQRDLARIRVCFVLVETVAYWTWQVYPWLAARALATEGPPVELRLVLTSYDGWHEASGQEPKMPHWNVVGQRVELELDPSYAAALRRADNSGERELVRAIARGLRALLQARPELATDDPDAHACLDTHAPRGGKKYFLHPDPDRDPVLAENDLPELRVLQEADDAVILDRLGPAVAERLGLPIGPVSAETRLDVLRGAVGWAFEELERLLSTLDPAEALEWFVGHSERVLQAQRAQRLRAPALLACFGDMPETRERIERDRDELVQTAICVRTVIEILTARPPVGIRPMSLEVHDQALALANEGVKRAFAYDGIKLGLHDLVVSILPSGRLGMSRGGALERARAEFMPVQASSELDQSVANFRRFWEPSGRSAEEILKLLDPAAQVDLGFTITELATVLFEISAYGWELSGAAKVVRREMLVDLLAERMDWPRERLDGAIAFFSLGSRDAFLIAPPPHSDSEVFPWRYGRELSYVRRPLLLGQRDGRTEITFGPRHLIEAGELYDICLSGRIPPQMAALRKVVEMLRKRDAAAFVKRVAAHYRTMPYTRVEVPLRKIGGRLIERAPGQTIGDIDVLVVFLRERRILAVEVKDLAAGRTPHEIERQIREIFVTRGRRPARAAVHLERVLYLREHLGELLTQLGIRDDSGPWIVEGLMVTSRELLAPYVKSPPVPVTSFRELTR